jgi:hypothetical protein
MPGPVIQRNVNARFLTNMASYDTASDICGALAQRIVNPRFLCDMASYDVVSNICQQYLPEPLSVMSSTTETR